MDIPIVPGCDEERILSANASNGTSLGRVLDLLDGGTTTYSSVRNPSWCVLFVFLQQHYDHAVVSDDSQLRDGEAGAAHYALTWWGRRFAHDTAIACYDTDLDDERVAFARVFRHKDWPYIVESTPVEIYLRGVSTSISNLSSFWTALEDGTHAAFDFCVPRVIMNLIIASQHHVAVRRNGLLALQYVQLAAVLGIRSAAAFVVTHWWPFDLHDVFWNLARLRRAIWLGEPVPFWDFASQLPSSSSLCKVVSLGVSCLSDGLIFTASRRKWVPYCDEGGPQWLSLRSLPKSMLLESTGHAWILPVTQAVNPWHVMTWLIPATNWVLTSGVKVDVVIPYCDEITFNFWLAHTRAPQSLSLFEKLSGLNVAVRPLNGIQGKAVCYDNLFFGRGDYAYPFPGSFRDMQQRSDILTSQHLIPVRSKLDQVLASYIKPTIDTTVARSRPFGLFVQRARGFSRRITNALAVARALADNVLIDGSPMDWRVMEEKVIMPTGHGLPGIHLHNLERSSTLAIEQQRPAMVMPSDEAVADILLLIRRTWLLVGAHGGFLAWGIFMEPGSALVELGKENYFGADDKGLNELDPALFAHKCGAWNADKWGIYAVQGQLAALHYGCVHLRHAALSYLKGSLQVDKHWHGNVSISIPELKRLLWIMPKLRAPKNDLAP